MGKCITIFSHLIGQCSFHRKIVTRLFVGFHPMTSRDLLPRSYNKSLCVVFLSHLNVEEQPHDIANIGRFCREIQKYDQGLGAMTTLPFLISMPPVYKYNNNNNYLIMLLSTPNKIVA